MPIPPFTRNVVAIAVVVALVIAAAINANRSVTGADARTKLTLIAPAAPGGGWDLLARESQQAMRSAGIVNTVAVNNIPGAGGTIALSTLAQLQGRPSFLMVTGTVMMGGISRNKADTTLHQLTPIARLAQDFEVIVVPKNSPYRTLDQLFEAWRKHPGSIPIGGGSAGGIDHMVAAQMARAAKIDPTKLKYSAHAGGGELTISLLSTASGTVKVGISSYNDFRDLFVNGSLRALAVVAPQRIDGLDAPTMIELGYHDVDLVNWRGLVAPAGISPAQRAELIAIAQEMVSTESWQAAMQRNRWQEWLLTGDEFGAFLIEEQQRIDRILQDLGLT